MRTELALSHVGVTPGVETRVPVEVTNTSEVIDGVTAIVDGVNPDWIRVEPPVMSLFPGTSARMELVFDIPPSCPAGDYLVVVQIVSTLHAERQSVHDFWLTVGSVPGVDLSMRPRIVSGRKHGVTTATIVNTGNCPLDVRLDAIEPSREVDCLLESSALTIPQGHEALIDITFRGPRPWFGSPDTRTITVTATAPDLAVEEIVTFNQKPRIPRGLVTALILASIIALWAFIFFWAIREMRSKDPITKTLSPTILEGEENIPLAEIAGSAEGRVTAAPMAAPTGLVSGDGAAADNADGLGIAAITVEARRLLPDGTHENVASVATAEDGTFRLEALLPGTYKFRFSAEGYPTRWLGDVGKPRKATEVEIDPLTAVDGLGIGLSGRSGTIEGTVALPPGTAAPGSGGDGADGGSDGAGNGSDGAGNGSDGAGNGSADAPTETALTAVATLAPQAGQEEFTSEEVPVLSDGSYTIEGLPTPATYTVTVSGDNFETQHFQTTLGGGETPQLNPVYLEPGPASVSGSVVDESGQPLGAVEIVARAGSTEYTSTTPTAGAVGSFTLTDLPTPETYVLSFHKEGFSSETVALALGPGEELELPPAQLIQGIGTITGRASTVGGVPAGNVPVRVFGDGVFAETSTLSADGTFTLSGLPVPGHYSVTVGGDAFQPETALVEFDATAPDTFGTPRDIGNVLLLRSTATVGGTLRVAGVELDLLTIELTDGVLRRTTRPAAQPEGRYEFTDVPEGSYSLIVTRGVEQTDVLWVQGADVVAGVDSTIDITVPGRR